MAYPDKINALVDVTADQTLAAGGHAARHNDVNDALDELEAVFTAPAANELALRPDGSTEAVRIDSSGNVGIGTTNPTGNLEVIGGGSVGPVFNQAQTIVCSDLTHSGITIFSGDASNGWLAFGDSADGVAGAINYSHAADEMYVTTRSDARFTFDGFGRFIPGGGVYLGGTAAGNLLDDYEEGTWTPTLTTLGTDFTSVTYNGQTGGKYTKIGRVVYFHFYLRTDAITVGSASGNLVVAGLPFTSLTDTFGTRGAVAASLWEGDNFSSNRPAAAHVILNSDQIQLIYRTSSNSDYSENTFADVATGGNANRIGCSGFYFTA